MKSKSILSRVIFILPLLLLTCIGGQRADALPGISGAQANQVVAGTGPAWFAVDLDSGLVLYEDAADVKVPPASTTKLLTALTALQVLDLNEEVTIIDSDLVAEEFSRMGLEVGDVVTVEQLLYGALIPSGGDAARALARTGGQRLDPENPDPTERYVQEMNAVAISLGMSSTSLGNPVGRDDERSWTTARDLVRAGAAVLSEPLLSTIVRTPWAGMVIGGPNQREIVLENSNQFVLFDDAIGIKTGTTDAAGQNLISAFRFGDRIVVTVVLGSSDRYADTTVMLDSVREKWAWLQLGRDFASYGASDELAANDLWMPVARTVLLRTEQTTQVSYEITIDENPAGVAVGRVTFWSGPEVIAILPIYPIGRPGDE